MSDVTLFSIGTLLTLMQGTLEGLGAKQIVLYFAVILTILYTVER